jgi:choline dehydrogenase-like flavoprotein
MLAGIALPGFGARMRADLSLLPKTAVSISLMIDGFADDEAGGTVSLRPDGNPRLDYPFAARHYECWRAGMKALARVHLANGALRVQSLHVDPVVLRAESDLRKLDDASLGPNLCGVFTAHQMGGCGMGEDPSRSVVDPDLRHHYLTNLWIADGSVFPTSLGVNPMQSIYGISSWAAERIRASLARS